MSVKFLILSEDGSASAVPALAALLKSMFSVFVPELRRVANRPDLLRFEPAEERLRSALSGNKWRSRKVADQAYRTNLAQSIAAQLARPDGFVVFHFDGDTRYAERHRSDTGEQYRKQIEDRVAQILRSKRKDCEIPSLLSKLIVITPFYCLEAWTYYNTAVLRTLVPNTRDSSKIDEWVRTPGSVEEVEKPWSLISVGKSHNRQLAEESFPVMVPFAAGKSFADAIMFMMFNETLVDALNSTVGSLIDYYNRRSHP